MFGFLFGSSKSSKRSSSSRSRDYDRSYYSGSRSRDSGRSKSSKSSRSHDYYYDRPTLYDYSWGAATGVTAAVVGGRYFAGPAKPKATKVVQRGLDNYFEVPRRARW